MFDDEPWVRPAVVIALATLAAAGGVRLITGYPAAPSGMTSLVVASLIVALTATARLLTAIFRMWRAGVAHPIAQLRSAAPAALREQWLILLGVTVVAVLLFSTSFLKSMITAVVPFWADDTLAKVDAAIGLNGQFLANAIRPWLPAVGLFYGLWHISNLGGILWVIHWRGPARGRFILSFMLTWAIGMFAAYLVSSAGPLFIGSYDLAAAPDSVQVPARFLWANYQAKGALLGGGISAFPSLHVGIATWFALVLAHRGWPKLGLAYVAAIYFGSVVLGWHYGADGAGGIIVALAADWLSRKCVRRNGQDATPSVIAAFQQSPKKERSDRRLGGDHRAADAS
ncbi:phosphatase PAP2 family protein [Sphingomonas jaspsi]|uniref:phosphatase PAP2 family protein n=1 Tax=Sphingomonas jaspsi TaxID=392409 RepID=UPI000561F0D6|nr:phosphatase PAP2 family protein [Sphingomonas jaspsi]